MNLTRSLYSIVSGGLNAERDSAEFIYAYAESVLYITGAASAFEYQEYIKPFCEESSAKVFRLSIQDQKYTNLDLKLFTLRMGQQRSLTRKEAFALGAEYGIHRNDILLVHTLFSDNTWFRRLVKESGRKVSKDNLLFDPAQINSLFNRVYPAILKYIKFISYKKLRFVVKSDNLGFEDIHSELSTKVLQSFYSLIPAQATEAHIVNYLKRAVHNHAINMIKSRTSQKRGRLVNVGSDKHNEQQFNLLVVSQNQLAKGFDEDGNEVDMLNVANEDNAKFELQFTISQVLNSVKANKKKYRFLMLLLGVEDDGFTSWLRSEGLCKPSEDNVDVQSRTKATDFNRYVAEFLRVSTYKVNKFLGEIRDMVEVK